MSQELYNRQITVTVGTKQFSGLRMAFSVANSLDPEPNTAEISIWNLSKTSRAEFADKDQTVSIEAGYDGLKGLIFSGTLRKAQSVQQGADWVTTLKSGDGEIPYRTAKIAKSYKKGTKITTVLKDLLDSLGLTLSKQNKDKIDGATFTKKLTEFAHGLTVQGPSRERIKQLLKGFGLEWSIQKGEIQILEAGQVLNEQVELISPDHGLIGSPEMGEEHRIKITSLLRPDIAPGHKVQLKSSAYTNGVDLRAEKVNHSGDNFSQTWYTEIEGKAV